MRQDKWEQFKAPSSAKTDWSQYKQPSLAKEAVEELPLKSQGFAGIGQDILSAAKEIPGVIAATPGQISGIKQQAKEDPFRIAKNLAAGVGEAGISTLNMPHQIIKYLGEKGLAPEWLRKYNELPFTHIPEDLGVEKAIGLEEEKPGDVLLKLIPGLVGGYGVKKFAGPRSLNSLERELNAQNKFIADTQAFHKQFLGEGQEHGARASQSLLDYIEGKVNPETGRTEGGLRRQIGSQYEQLANDMANERVQIHQTPDMKGIQASLKKLGRGVSSAEREKLLRMMTQADSKLQTVNGADALTAYRELKRQRSKSLQSAYEPGIGPKEHEQWIKRSEEFGDLEKRMKDMLEKQIGGKYLERLKSIDKDYATKIAPLSENSMYQEMRKHGQTSKNIMKYLHGKTAGNETLNAIVSENPELQRLLVGQQFASKPEKLAEAGELVDKYASLNPHISKIIEEQRRMKMLKERGIPELEESIKKLTEKKMKKQAFRRGVGATIGTLGGGYALETALGRDWKKDLPWLAALKTLKSR